MGAQQSMSLVLVQESPSPAGQAGGHTKRRTRSLIRPSRWNQVVLLLLAFALAADISPMGPACRFACP